MLEHNSGSHMVVFHCSARRMTVQISLFWGRFFAADLRRAEVFSASAQNMMQMGGRLASSSSWVKPKCSQLYRSMASQRPL